MGLQTRWKHHTSIISLYSNSSVQSKASKYSLYLTPSKNAKGQIKSRIISMSMNLHWPVLIKVSSGRYLLKVFYHSSHLSYFIKIEKQRNKVQMLLRISSLNTWSFWKSSNGFISFLLIIFISSAKIAKHKPTIAKKAEQNSQTMRFVKRLLLVRTTCNLSLSA